MLLTHSFKRKVVATCGAALGFAGLLHEARVLDSQSAGDEAEAREATAPPVPGAHLRFSATAYCKGAVTAAGTAARTGVAAADPALLPVGSVVRVDNLGPRYNGIYTVMDTGPAVAGREVDSCMWSCQEAQAFGRRAARLTVLRLVEPKGHLGVGAPVGGRAGGPGPAQRQGPDRWNAPEHRRGPKLAPRAMTTPALERLLEHTERAERRHFWFRGFRRFVRPLIAEAAAGRRDLALLDCGCGTGSNLGLLDPYGTAFGFDLTKAGVEFAVSRYGRRRVAQASVIHVPFRSSCFDVLTSFDVMVCLDREQEAEALSEFHRVLKPGGALILNVAALELLRGVHSVNAREVHRYRRTHMRAVLARAGFVIDRITYTNATLLPLVLPMRLLQRAKGLPSLEECPANELVVPVAPLNALLTWALILESWLLRCVNMPAGSSLLVLAHKRLEAWGPGFGQLGA